MDHVQGGSCMSCTLLSVTAEACTLHVYLCSSTADLARRAKDVKKCASQPANMSGIHGGQTGVHFSNHTIGVGRDHY